MAQLLVRRLGMLLLTLLISSFAIFSALSLAPGDPLASLSGGRALPPESVAVLEQRFHLDDPFLLRYWHWLSGAVQGDLGVSIMLRQNVSELIGARIGVTATLVLYAALLIVLFGVAAGVLAALRPGWLDSAVLVATAVAAAVPSFLLAVILISVFAVNLGWFPAFGDGDGGFLDRIWHLTLPAVALAGYSMAVVARVTRAAVREEAGREHVQTAISRGVPYRLVISRHVLRNAAIPISTVVGITVASLIAISAVVERAFGLNGLGAYLISSALSKDFAVVLGIALVLVTAFVVINTLVDVAAALLDPRVKTGGKAS